jgi:hypothetical protein
MIRRLPGTALVVLVLFLVAAPSASLGAAEASEPDSPAAPPDSASGSAESGGPDQGAIAPSETITVLRAYICKGIEESEPTEAGKSFIPQTDGTLRLCCFSEVATAAPDTIVHVWYWGDREMARVPLAVRGPRWRTWSTKQILDEWRGEWHVDITERSGAVLARLGFSVE